MILFQYLLALILTLLTECLVGYLLGYKTKKSLHTIILVNLVTHPVLGFFLWLNSIAEFINNYDVIIVLELIIVVAEFGLLRYALREKPGAMLKLSISMNAVSFFIGLLIFGYNF